MPGKRSSHLADRRNSATPSEDAQRLVVAGKRVRLCVQHRLQPVLHHAEECVGALQVPSLPGRQVPCIAERIDRLDGIPFAHGRVPPSVEKLEGLDDEFNIPDPARHQLDVGLVANRRFDAGLDPRNGSCGRRHERSRIDEGLEVFEEFPAQGLVAGHGTSFDQHLAFPHLPPRFIIGRVAFHGADEGACSRFRPESDIDTVQIALVGQLRQVPDKSFRQPGEIFVCPGISPVIGVPLLRIHEDHVNVGAIIELATPQLPQPDDAKGNLRTPAKLLVHLTGCNLQRGIDDGIGQKGELERGGRHIGMAEDVLRADPQELAAMETFEGIELRFRLLERRCNPLHLFLQGILFQRRSEDVCSGYPAEESWFPDENVGKVLGRAAKSEQDLGPERVLENVAEQGGAVDNGSEITADVRQHHVGIGRADNCRSKEEGKLLGRKPAPRRNERLTKGVCDLHRSAGITKALRRDYRFIHGGKNTKNGMESPSPAIKQEVPTCLLFLARLPIFR